METNMLKTMTALLLGFLLAGAAAANAGDASRTPTYEIHAHRAVHHKSLDPRARALAPAPTRAVTLRQPKTDGLSGTPDNAAFFAFQFRRS
jgi:hypothetical protein